MWRNWEFSVQDISNKTTPSIEINKIKKFFSKDTENNREGNEWTFHVKVSKNFDNLQIYAETFGNIQPSVFCSWEAWKSKMNELQM